MFSHVWRTLGVRGRCAVLCSFYKPLAPFGDQVRGLACLPVRLVALCGGYGAPRILVMLIRVKAPDQLLVYGDAR